MSQSKYDLVISPCHTKTGLLEYKITKVNRWHLLFKVGEYIPRDYLHSNQHGTFLNGGSGHSFRVRIVK